MKSASLRIDVQNLKKTKENVTSGMKNENT